MLNIIQNTIGAIRRVGESVVRAGLKMWLPFTSAEPLGENLVVNGDFSDGTTGWQSSGSDWTFSNNSAVYVGDGSASELLQNINFVGGKLYKIVIDVASISGTLKVRFNNDQANKVTFNTVGENIIYITTSGTGLINNDISISRESGVVNSVINSVSVEEYAQETLDTSNNDNNAILKTGKALVFAGNDSVETSFPSSKTIKTIAFWIYPTHSASQEALFNLGMTNIPVPNLGDRVIELNHLTIRNRINYPLNFDVYIDGVYRGETNWNGDNPTLLLNQWQRVVLVNSNGTSTVNDTFDVAYTGSGSHGRFKMSDLQIYGAEFTTNDIAYDYANPQKLVTDNASSNVTLNDLHAWWHMSEGDGTIAFDSAPLIGRELLNNPINETNWTLDEGWTADNGIATRNGGSVVGRYLRQSISGLVNGNVYKASFTISNLSTPTTTIGISSSGFLGNVSSNERFITENGDFSITGTFDNQRVNPTELRFVGGANTTFSVSNVSVKEVFNIDGETYDGSSLGATYDDAQERIPQLGMMNWSKGSNLIDYSDSTFWSAINGAVRSFDSDIVNPDSTVGCWKVTFDGTINGRIQRPVVATGLLTYSVWLKVDSGTQPAQIGGSTSGALAITVTDEWQRFTHTQTYTSSTTYPRLRCDVDGAEIYIWLAQLEDADSASAYRRTNGTAVTDATLISSATDSQKDILGNAVRVKGSGFNLDGTGYGEVLHTTDFNFGIGDFSVSAWAKFSYIAQGSSFNAIYTNGGQVDSAGTFAIISINPNKIAVLVNGTSAVSTTTFSEGEWVHIVATRNSGAISLYINGNKTPEDTDTNINSVTSNQNPRIGFDNNTSRLYNDLIDDVQVYDEALTPEEVEQNYNATKSGHNN